MKVLILFFVSLAFTVFAFSNTAIAQNAIAQSAQVMGPGTGGVSHGLGFLFQQDIGEIIIKPTLNQDALAKGNAADNWIKDMSFQHAAKGVEKASLPKLKVDYWDSNTLDVAVKYVGNDNKDVTIPFTVKGEEMGKYSQEWNKAVLKNMAQPIEKWTEIQYQPKP